MNAEQLLGALMSQASDISIEKDEAPDVDSGPKKGIDAQVANLLAYMNQFEKSEVPPIGAFVKSTFYRIPNDRRPALVIEHIPPEDVKNAHINDDSSAPITRPDVIALCLRDDGDPMLIPLDSRFLEIHNEATKAAESV